MKYMTYIGIYEYEEDKNGDRINIMDWKQNEGLLSFDNIDDVVDFQITAVHALTRNWCVTDHEFKPKRYNISLK